MSRERMTTVGESAALLLPKDILDKLGIAIGNEVEISLIDRPLTLQPLAEADRAQQFAALTKMVSERRQSAYTRLVQRPEQRNCMQEMMTLGPCSWLLRRLK
jgi:antitoxin component of MazEF toxin-antitoxin module